MGEDQQPDGRPCVVCGNPVPTRPRGRPSVYCSRSCQAKAYRSRKAYQARRSGGEHVDVDQAGQARAAAAELARAALFLISVVEHPTVAPDVAPTVQAARTALDTLTSLATAAAATEDDYRERGEERQEPPAVPQPATPTPARVRKTRDETPPPPEPAAVDAPDQAEWERQRAEEHARWEKALKPVAELGEGYLMAEWPGTGRYVLTLHGERIGYAERRRGGWGAHTPTGTAITASVNATRTGAYKNRAAALAAVAAAHQRYTVTTKQAKRRNRTT